METVICCLRFNIEIIVEVCLDFICPGLNINTVFFLFASNMYKYSSIHI